MYHLGTLFFVALLACGLPSQIRHTRELGTSIDHLAETMRHSFFPPQGNSNLSLPRCAAKGMMSQCRTGARNMINSSHTPSVSTWASYQIPETAASTWPGD
jgi:hypothetical protein